MRKGFLITGVTLVLALMTPLGSVSQPETVKIPADKGQTPTLDRAVMCEKIKDFLPFHSAVAFSISVGNVSCYTFFDPVPEKTVVYHQWFHRDKPSTKKRLTLNPPRWATFSTIQLRLADIGPWRVEITDENNRLLKTLRFSVTQ